MRPLRSLFVNYLMWNGTATERDRIKNTQCDVARMNQGTGSSTNGEVHWTESTRELQRAGEAFMHDGVRTCIVSTSDSWYISWYISWYFMIFHDCISLIWFGTPISTARRVCCLHISPGTQAASQEGRLGPARVSGLGGERVNGVTGCSFCGRWWLLPSDKHRKNDGKSPCHQWVNPLKNDGTSPCHQWVHPLKNDGNSPFSAGKFTISMAIFNSYGLSGVHPCLLAARIDPCCAAGFSWLLARHGRELQVRANRERMCPAWWWHSQFAMVKPRP